MKNVKSLSLMAVSRTMGASAFAAPLSAFANETTEDTMLISDVSDTADQQETDSAAVNTVEYKDNFDNVY